jgi:hypothetical protein
MMTLNFSRKAPNLSYILGENTPGSRTRVKCPSRARLLRIGMRTSARVMFPFLYPALLEPFFPNVASNIKRKTGTMTLKMIGIPLRRSPARVLAGTTTWTLEKKPKTTAQNLVSRRRRRTALSLPGRVGQPSSDSRHPPIWPLRLCHLHFRPIFL